MKKSIRLCAAIAALCCVLFSGGCTTTSGSNTINKENVSQIQTGVTSKDDLIAKFGPAKYEKTSASGQISLGWELLQTKANASAYMPFGIGTLAGTASSTFRSLNVTLSPNGIVEHYSYSDANGEGKGMGQTEGTVKVVEH